MPYILMDVAIPLWICYNHTDKPLDTLGTHLLILGECIIAHRYTNEQKAQALILLAANRGSVSMTSSQTGISSRAITKWANQEKELPSPDIGKGMETAIHYLMGQIPNLVNKYNIAELLGTLLEKWLQYQGVPQNSTQTILAVLSTKSETQLDQMINDIDKGRQLTLNNQQQVIDVEKEMASLGLLGLAERETPQGQIDPVLVGERSITTDSPTEVIDLIQYQTYDGEDPDSGDQPRGDSEDW